MTKTKQWVTIAIRGDDSQALDVERKLRKAGIPARILPDTGEAHEVAFHWAHKASFGGTAIQVDHRVVDEACEMLGILTPEEEAQRDGDEGHASDEDSERAAHLALTSAIVGLFICPGAAQIWSLVVCLRTWSSDLRSHVRRRLIIAATLDVLVLGVIALILLGVVEPPK